MSPIGLVTPLPNRRIPPNQDIHRGGRSNGPATPDEPIVDRPLSEISKIADAKESQSQQELCAATSRLTIQDLEGLPTDFGVLPPMATPVSETIATSPAERDQIDK